MISLLSIILFFFSSDLGATEIIPYQKSPVEINLNIIKVMPGQQGFEFIKTSYSFELLNDNGITMDLYCRGVVPEYYQQYSGHHQLPSKYQSSQLNYRNMANIEVATFKFSSHELCDVLGGFLLGVFEFIDRENPVKFNLDIKSMLVQKIYLPRLNIYMDRLPSMMIPELKNGDKGIILSEV